MAEEPRVRPADVSEAPTLSDLALRSKGYWGYDDAFLEACRAELTVQPGRIERHTVRVIEHGGVVCGFYMLSARAGKASAMATDDDESAMATDDDESAIVAASEGRGMATDAELDFFYLDPDVIGAGFGRTLWRHMVGAARRRGYRTISIHSDPNAEGFYEAMGAKRIGDVPSSSIAGRVLPLMRFDVDERD